MKKILCLIMVLVSTQLVAQETINPKNSRYDEFKIKSSFIENYEYTINVYLPHNYPPNQKYPLVFLLDANKGLQITKSLIDWLNPNSKLIKNKLENFILVGISYSNNDSVWWVDRSRDYIPTRDTISKFGKSWKYAGKADNFLNFIEKELTPTLSKKYNVDLSKTGIIGYSFGGLFASYSLFTRPNLFNRFIIIAPATSWDNSLVCFLEHKYSMTNKELNKKIYLAIGSLDNQYIINEPTIRFKDSLNLRNYPNLSLNFDFCEGETHTTIFPRAVSSGLIKCYGIEEEQKK